MKELKFLPDFLPKIKSGEKTCTRRLIKPQPPKECKYGLCDCTGEAFFPDFETFDCMFPEDGLIKCPYGEPGSVWTLEDGTEIIFEDISVERVQDISPEECLNEGINGLTDFLIIWDSIYKKRGYGWEENPLVWVIDFEVVK